MLYHILYFILYMCGFLYGLYVKIHIKTLHKEYNINEKIEHEYFSNSHLYKSHLDIINNKIKNIIDKLYHYLSLKDNSSDIIEELNIEIFVNPEHDKFKNLFYENAKYYDFTKIMNNIEKINKLTINAHSLFFFKFAFSFDKLINLKSLVIVGNNFPYSGNYIFNYNFTELNYYLDGITQNLELLCIKSTNIFFQRNCQLTNLPISLKYFIIETYILTEEFKSTFEYYLSKLPFGTKLFLGVYTYCTFNDIDNDIISSVINNDYLNFDLSILTNVNKIKLNKTETEKENNSVKKQFQKSKKLCIIS